MSVAAAHQKGSAAIPEAEHKLPASTHEQIDATIARVRENADRWVALGVPERIELLQTLIGTCDRVAERWVAEAIRAKGLTPGSALEAEEWLGGPMTTIRNLRLLADSLRDIQGHGRPRIPGGVTVRPDGQVVAHVFPVGIYDKALFSGFTAEIWMDPELRQEELTDTQALIYRDKGHEGKVALVLGAGNVSSIGPMDALYKLFVEDQVVVLKMNPVNEYLGPVFVEAFQPLISAGFFDVVYGGAAEGAYLCQHEGIDEIHITGSDKTHDAIVFGVGEEGARNKAERRPVNTKRITSELGNVSPIIVVPGPWSKADLAFQGTNLASSLTNNAGFNCNATRVIVQHETWNQREALLERIRAALRLAPSRPAYYPGAEQRYDAFVGAHPEADQIGTRAPGQLPWALIPHLRADDEGDICLTTEAFCGVTSELGIEADDVPAYIDKAVEFCNEKIWGSLNAAIIVHPESMKDPAVAAAVDRAVANLRAGTVAVNHWPALAYAFGTTTWGAFPGHDLYDIQSGIGVVHNTLMFDRVQKTVVRGPFRVRPKPVWFVGHKTAAEVGKKLTHFEAAPAAWKLPSLIWSALRG